ncbi:MerR family transcriptional regulator [Streptomyces drozdowiczii]|uniref:MerR family transcriptional regulator n=1 Tax=Streptomyces drozdowiczii TaxID=202862 RepID=A0ABY6PUN7_9ACTN|nr:MerR family transcriptional regulator [Streptomyces drozdowiczii]MCX0244448.1 MerR family transcriptional regulator [Streptomyces drozdowiczii]UZK55782.1 MerR family transcriptional regulator [Streptomyces drozdowiczii]
MKSSEGAPLGIGAAAARFGLPAHVLRHWESVGLLDPARDAAGRRRYGVRDLERVATVVRAKRAGLALDTIRLLVSASEPDRRRAVLGAEAERLRAVIDAARASLELVECALSCGHEDITRCPHYRAVIAAGG